jgi:hypothetical protein
MAIPTEPSDRQRPVDAVAGLLASAAMFAGLIALAYRPVRVAPFAIGVALVAVAMSSRHTRLAALALAVTTASFVGGMVIAVVTENPLF